jgi:hypothetical protein
VNSQEAGVDFIGRLPARPGARTVIPSPAPSATPPVIPTP